MRAAWLYQGGNPDYAKLARYEITGLYFDIRDPRLAPGFLDAVKHNTGITTVGVYVVASWFPQLTGPGLAVYTSSRLREIGWLGKPPVMFDIEGSKFDITGYVLPCLQRWRELRPTRITDLTIEGHQGGLFTTTTAVLVSAKVRWVVPQCYSGDPMEPWDTFAMVYDLISAGFAPGKVRPFYDGAHVLPWFGIPDGFVFTAERLP